MVIYDLKTMAKAEICENTIVALGAFDGCHYAHQSVLCEAFYEARRLGVKSVAYTFSTLPKNAKSIYTLEEKIKAISKIGIDYVAIDGFGDVRDLSPQSFFFEVLREKLSAVNASCGFNYKFGKDASGNCELLKELFLKNTGRSVRVSPELTIENRTVSSTLLRTLLEKGQIDELGKYGSKYSVYNMVLMGKQLGREMGFPTINQKIPEDKAVPKYGVYITECEIGEDVYPSITNVGVRPSVDDGDSVNMETYIIGYSGVLYGSYIRVNFYKYLRGEIRFDSLDELKAQISLDTEKAKEYFK